MHVAALVWVTLKTVLWSVISVTALCKSLIVSGISNKQECDSS